MVYDKKQIELNHLEAFRKAFSVFPAGEITATEEPDFLIHTSSGTIGIEVTELYRESSGKVPLQATESIRDKILYKAGTVYAERENPVVWVSVRFGDLAGFPNNRVDAVARRIAAIVEENLLEGYDSIEVENSWDDLEYFPAELDSLHIRRPANASKSHWSAPIAAYMPPLTIEDIQETIAGKDKRLGSYRQKAVEMWLLIVHGRPDRASTMFDTEQSLSQHRFETEFDRVFLFDKFGSESIELCTTGVERTAT